MIPSAATRTILAIFALNASLLSQSDNQRPEFEVASVKATKADLLDNNSRLPSLNVDPGRRLNFVSINLKDIIMLAYGVGAAQIDGLRTSINRFDIIAQIPPGTSKEQIPIMLQTLLAQRFKLTLHREQKSIPVYALEIGKAGSRLQESSQNASREPGCTRSYTDNPESMFVAVCQRIATAGLVQAVQTMAPNYFDRPVVDMTGLKGVYDITLQWISFAQSMNGEDPTIFAAVQGLGLEMKTRKRAMEVLVVDHCETMPTEN